MSITWERSNLVIAILSLLMTGCVGRDVPAQLTTDKLLSIKPGDSYVHVEATLGPPLCYSTQKYGENAFCSDDPRSVPEADRAKLTRLEYFRDTLHLVYPKSYIYFNSGSVDTVYVKESFFYDDMGICCMESEKPESPFYGGGSRERLIRLIGR